MALLPKRVILLCALSCIILSVVDAGTNAPEGVPQGKNGREKLKVRIVSNDDEYVGSSSTETAETSSSSSSTSSSGNNSDEDVPILVTGKYSNGAIMPEDRLEQLADQVFPPGLLEPVMIDRAQDRHKTTRITIVSPRTVVSHQDKELEVKNQSLVMIIIFFLIRIITCFLYRPGP